ncbi:hypothetical protein Tco_0431049 [Tanacetum coccineum]
MEDIDAFLEHDDSIPPGVDGTYDSEGDTVYLEELLTRYTGSSNGKGKSVVGKGRKEKGGKRIRRVQEQGRGGQEAGWSETRRGVGITINEGARKRNRSRYRGEEKQGTGEVKRRKCEEQGSQVKGKRGGEEKGEESTGVQRQERGERRNDRRLCGQEKKGSKWGREQGGSYQKSKGGEGGKEEETGKGKKSGKVRGPWSGRKQTGRKVCSSVGMWKAFIPSASERVLVGARKERRGQGIRGVVKGEWEAKELGFSRLRESIRVGGEGRNRREVENRRGDQEREWKEEKSEKKTNAERYRRRRGAEVERREEGRKVVRESGREVGRRGVAQEQEEKEGEGIKRRDKAGKRGSRETQGQGKKGRQSGGKGAE